MEEERDEYHPLGVAQVGDREDRDPRTPVGRAEEEVDVEGIASEPSVKAGARKKVVEGDGKLVALLPRVEAFQIQDPDFLNLRILDARDEQLDVEGLLAGPRLGDDRYKEEVFAALYRVRFDAEEAEQATDDAKRLLPDRFGIGPLGRRRERLHKRDRHSETGAGRIHADVSRIFQSLNTGAILVACREARRPLLCLLCRVFAFRNPGEEVFRSKLGERQQEIRQIPFRIDDNRRNLVDRRLFEERNREAGLSASRHSDHDAVGREVARLIEVGMGGRAVSRRLAEVKDAKLLVVGEHAGRCSP